jgi:hypothetical protein
VHHSGVAGFFWIINLFSQKLPLVATASGADSDTGTDRQILLLRQYASQFGMTKPLRSVLPQLLATLVSMVLLLVALALPWYTVSSYSGGEVPDEHKMDFSFGGTYSETKHGSQTWSQTTSWNEYRDNYARFHDGKTTSLFGLYLGAMALGIIAFLMALVAFIMIVLDKIGKLPRKMARDLPVPLLIGAVMGYLVIGYFAVGHSGALKTDSNSGAMSPGWDVSFIGNYSSNIDYYYTSAWGPNIGWILEIAGASFLVVALMLTRVGRMPVRRSAPGQ